jgi:hypothetical protein
MVDDEHGEEFNDDAGSEKENEKSSTQKLSLSRIRCYTTRHVNRKPTSGLAFPEFIVVRCCAYLNW